MKTLAITIGGAVSLGSFEAGAMYEILQALKQHNTDPRTTEDQKIVIDVLTGASAGGMTAAIAAQRLLFDAPSLESAGGNAFYVPWVRTVGLTGLLALKADESPSLSVLSSDLIQDVSRKFLTDRYAGAAPARNAHPAAADTIYLGLAMSNLSGIDYSIPLLTGSEFVYTRFQDAYSVPLTKGSAGDDSLVRWEAIRGAAVACGAFPFAFRIQEVQRSAGDYPGHHDLPPTLGRYAYTDGGMFQNEPLGLTKNLVDKLDPDHASHESRFYLFVAPDLRSSVMDDGKFTAPDATFLNTAQRLITAIFNQARYQDWVRAETLNKKIQRLDAEADTLMKSIQAGTVSAAAIGPANAQLLQVVYPDQAERAAALTRLQLQYAQEYGQLGGGGPDPSTANEYIKAVAVLEQLLGVSSYDKMRVYAISAGRDDLAGSCLMAFGGFFDQSYRQHDYDIGRAAAQQFINDLNDGCLNPSDPAEPSLGPIHCSFDPGAIPKPDPGLNEVDVSRLPLGMRQQLRTQVQDRINTALEELNINLLERAGIINLVVSPKLNQLFHL